MNNNVNNIQNNIVTQIPDENTNPKAIVVDTENMRRIKNEILTHIENIKKIIIDSNLKIDDIKKIYNMPSYDYLRKKSTEFFEENMNEINNVYIPLIESLENIASEYDNLFNEDSNSIKGATTTINTFNQGVTNGL